MQTPDGLYVFLGPTLPRAGASRILDATYLPPVAQGDVIRLCERRPRAIGIVDGYFENIPSVWHKEILHAIHQGVAVFGSSSMGALRAAELHPFGMIGVGAVFEAFRDGRLEDDDEVAVIHGPAELGYPGLSEAMVNIRRTLADAAQEGIVPAATARRLEAIAKALPYRERGYGRVLRLAAAEGLPEEELADFRHWLPNGRIDQKREDALDLLQTMRRWAAGGGRAPEARFHFEHTVLWDRALRDGAPLQAANPLD
ncbi:TfuA-like protein [Azospirillum brasilense]|uniref:TfuA protein n=1 Tax=Azospirillum brasilense TaxID=192 RepID=A0A6L3ASX1_AZOBR|nr:TfuA-like protein [Azospirillum brasilense]KAA0678891.1 tfuA protein [Azospirillum brasilense]